MSICEERVFEKFGIDKPIRFKTCINNNWYNGNIQDIVFYYDPDNLSLGDIWVYYNSDSSEKLMCTRDEFINRLQEFIATFFESRGLIATFFESRGLPTYNMRYDDNQDVYYTSFDENENSNENVEDIISFIVCEEFTRSFLYWQSGASSKNKN